MASMLKNSLVHWRKKLERTSDEIAILATFHKLAKIPITVDLLQDTGIGKIIRTLAKKPGKVGSKASSILQNWREVVASAQIIQTSPSKESPKHSSHKKEDYKKHSSHKKEEHSKHSSRKKEEHAKHSSRKKEENTKHSSHKREISSEVKVYDENFSKQSSSSQDKHKKSKHSSVSSHKQKLLSSGSEYNSIDNLFQPDNIKKEHESTFDLNSNGDLDEYKQSFHSKESHKVSEKPLKNGEKKHKTKVNSDDILSGKTIKKEHSPKDSNDRKRKYEISIHSNGTHEKKKHKHESPVSSPIKRELNGSTSKKTDKDKKSSKSNDHKTKVDSKTHLPEKELLSSVKKSKESKIKVTSKPKTFINIASTEAFTSSDARFEDCLGFSDIVPVKRKKSSKSTSLKKGKHVPAKKDTTNGETIHKKANSSSKSKHDKVGTKSPDVPKLLLEPAPTLNEVDILSTLPQTQPTYRPLPQRSYDCISPNKKKVLSNEDAIKFMSSKREKTSVYSGRRNVFYTEVPTLFDSCIRVLIENIDAIEYMGGVVPFYILKQVLVRCSAQQLYNIEDYNPYLLEDTQELWEVHCKKDFRNHQPQENETWRDLYWRASEEREKKLRNLTANISASMTTKYKPGRQVKMAYVDTFVKPPREVARKQAKHGTALPVNHPVKAAPPSKATPRPVAPVINSAASHSREREYVPKKPKVAPLMAKTLKSMKQCFRR